MQSAECKIEVWFWQLIVSPHMAGLAKALAEKGCKVVYVARHEMSRNRASQGWTFPPLGAVKLELMPNRKAIKSLVVSATSDSIHICQGIRGNGIISEVQDILAEHKLSQWAIMETVADRGWRGPIKRFAYRRLILRMNTNLEGVLAIGESTGEWLAARSMPEDKVVPFAYFLPEDNLHLTGPAMSESSPFRILFVGQFIERKRLDLLIVAIAEIDHPNVELVVVGSGPLEKRFRQQAETLLPERVDWVGQLSITEVRQQMVHADCLVLPSRHDGWGATVTEALMVGTPVICSDRCGSSEVVRVSGAGGIFSSNNKDDLKRRLEKAIDNGKPSAALRTKLARWARSLGATSGADYLLNVLRCKKSGTTFPPPPWIRQQSEAS